MNLPYPIRVALVDDHALVRDGIKALLAVMPPLEVVGEAESGAEPSRWSGAASRTCCWSTSACRT